MSEAEIGYKSQFWIEDLRDSPEQSPPLLFKLNEVRRIQNPDSAGFEQAEATHLESPGRRREFVDTFYEDTDFEVEMNRVPGSETELVIKALQGQNGTYAARIVEYDGDVHVATHDFDVRNIRYAPSDLEADQVKTAVMTYKAASTVATEYPA